MKKIMVDMDNVITDGVFKDYIEEFYNIKFDLNDISEYAYVQHMTKERTEEFWKFVENKNFYENAPLFDGCYEVLEELNKVYDVYIVTSYLWKETIDISGKNLANKYYYLREKLPFIGPEKYIFATIKDMMNFDVRIDDRLDNIRGADIKLLLTAWHNRSISDETLKKEDVIRVDDWYQIRNILLKEDIC